MVKILLMKSSQKLYDNVLKKALLKESVSVDATHVEANTIKKTPERLMKHLAKKIIKTCESELGKTIDNIKDAPYYKENHKEANEILNDSNFIQQKGVRSIIDEEV